MRTLDIALKDILQIVRDRRSLMFLVLMPLVFTLFMGYAYRRGATAEDTRPVIGWLNQDPNGLLATRLEGLLDSAEAVRLQALTPAQAADPAAAARADYAAVLVVPSGFSQTTLEGQKARLTLIVDEASQDGQAARQAVRVATVRLLSAAEAAQLSDLALEAQGVPAAQVGDLSFAAAVDEALQGWQTPMLSVTVEPVRTAAVSADDTFWANPYNQASPGMIVQFALFGLVSLSTIVVQERKSRTLQRMLTTSLPRSAVVAGHLLGMFALVFIQELVLVVFGQFALGVNYLREPLATLLLMVAMGLWIASMGLLVAVLVKGEEQVIVFALMGMFLFTALAGAWFPLEVTGPAFNTIGHLTPGAWAMDGFQNILIRGQGLSSVLLPAAIILGYGLLFFAVASWRLRYAEG